ncbi:apolipoprotein N-acyltransferase [Beggiatoa alba]|nr:apolipoprotein N-acyltransferase [Beggiatoa alba]
MDGLAAIKNINQITDWKQYVIALIAGLCFPLSFAPVYAIPLVFLSTLVLFALWMNKAPKQAFKLGFVFGFGLFSVGISWVYVAIHVYGATDAWIAVILTALFAAYLALFIALQAWLGARLRVQFQISLPLYMLIILPVLWVLFEWLRGWFFTGMPWLLMGYAFSVPPLSGFAPVLGVYGVSFFSILLAALMLFLVYETDKTRRLFAITALLLILLLGFGLSKIQWTQQKDKSIKVSLVQGNAEQLTKWDADKVRLRMETYARLTREHWDSDVIIWPENAMTIFYHQLDEDYLLPLAKQAKQSDTDLIVGIPFMDLDTEHYYSSMMSFSAADNNPSSYSGVFHKVHLVPFGEYVPFERLIRGLVDFFDLPMSSFSQGKQVQPLLTMRGEPLATSICYEDAFGEELIRQLPEATLLINGSNNAWYGDSLAPHQHLQIAQMRAIETGRMLIRATTNGISAFINHKGEVVAEAPQFESNVLTYSVQPRTGTTAYVRWGNWPIISFSFLALLAVIIYANRVNPKLIS